VYRIRTKDFNLDHTLSCGQVFRWQKDDQWTGIINGAVIRAKQVNNELLIESSLKKDTIIDYFRLDDDIDKIYDSINCDEKIAYLIHKYKGLRLIRQDPWECLVSYICSSNNTIRNISNSIKRMCECFGNEVEKGIYSFPEPEVLAEVKLCDMSQCRLGFRSPRVLKVANMVANREFDLDGIKDVSFSQGRQELVKIEGVGNKIADCVLLFGFGKLDSFPVDTHIEQIMERYYGSNFMGAKSKKRDEIAHFARSYFGEFCGYAQEYLYLENRE
jgi:N-glycosylase/DNA lyase